MICRSMLTSQKQKSNKKTKNGEIEKQDAKK